MMDLTEIKDLTQKGFSQELILQRFKEQLIKDFSMCRIELKFPASNEYNASDFLNTIKNGLLDLHSSSFMELLYRIDLSESRLNSEIRNNKEKDRNELVAELIFKRILQKVILKLNYSSK